MLKVLFNSLNLDEIIDLVEKYDLYMQTANDDSSYAEGWGPACIEKFYDNEYLEGIRYE